MLSLIHSDAADERSSVDLGGRRILKKKKSQQPTARGSVANTIDIRISLNQHIT